VRRETSRNPESGYALLFVYAMAAAIAILLYTQLPRVVFEAQRDREQLLIDRGEQYSRGIQLYVHKFNKYPADFDALENSQNQRFLRHRYVDPMTGKDEWRLIHVGPGGVFTDSLINKNKAQDAASQFSTVMTELQQTGGNQVDPNQTVNIATRRQQSDQGGGAGIPGADPNNPGAQPGLQNGVPAPGALNADGTQSTANPNQPNPNQPNFGAPIANQLPPGAQPGQPSNPAVPPAAANLIGSLLTTPRPGGLAGLQSAQPAVDQNGNPVQPNGAQGQINGMPAPPGTSAASLGTAPGAGQVIGGGIAGVASKREQDGIKIYHDQKSINKWEFVYDIAKDPAKGGVAVPVPAPPNQNGAAGANTTSSPTTPAATSTTTPTAATPTPTTTVTQ
jgi:hypothetical protein